MPSEWIPESYQKIQKIYQHRIGLELLSLLKERKRFSQCKVVDLGCGTGELTRELALLVGEKGFVTGVDRDPGMIESARAKLFGEIDFVCEDIARWKPPQRESIDIVFSNAAIHWLKSWSDFESLLQNIHSYLRTDGKLAFRFSLKNHAFEAKNFLENAMGEFLGQPVPIQKSIFEAEKCFDLISRIFQVEYQEERKFSAFEKEEENLTWILFSQPLARYIPADNLRDFIDYLNEKWERRPVAVHGHHLIVLARKV